MKSNIALRIAAVLLCLTLLSAQLLSGMLARYTTQGASSDSARVAGFGKLTLTETEATYPIIPGAKISKDPKLTMTKSEVAVRIYVEIQAEGWQYDSTSNALIYQVGETTLLTAALASGWVYDSVSESKFTFHADLAPSDQNSEIYLLKDNAVAVSSAVSYEDYYHLTAALALNITARAEQID